MAFKMKLFVVQNNSITLVFSRMNSKKYNVQIAKAKASNKSSGCYHNLQAKGYRYIFNPYAYVSPREMYD